MTIYNVAEASLMTGAFIMLAIGFMMLLIAWRDDRLGMITYPPTTMVSIGIPIIMAGLLGVSRILAAWGIWPEFISPGETGFAIMRIVGAMLWVNLFILLLSGNLIPPHLRKD